MYVEYMFKFFFFQAEDGIRYSGVTGVQTCALPICIPKDFRDVPRPIAIVDDQTVSLSLESAMSAKQGFRRWPLKERPCLVGIELRRAGCRWRVTNPLFRLRVGLSLPPWL